ncbi:hypothetical protein [Deinococcus roseus]|uniref:Copper amine oxidase-like N-terminal domain-containing protein n=1 Tax=Deinococcus roseus TaxID=392414 RepID=A0ABQ2DMV6_9DEIO|nr:hypothetical protein [Deinococcus roseus]GGJ59262.1 hypothetical protein GCM10008938_51710 [Deinococcus roseus]
MKPIVPTLLLCLSTVLWTAQATPKGPQAHLRINHNLEVLFTDPMVPAVDGKGIFWASLHPAARLLGWQVEEKEPGALTVRANGHEVVLHEHAAKVHWDGHDTLMPAPLKPQGKAYLVPIAGLARLLGDQVSWNGDIRVLDITGPWNRPIRSLSLRSFESEAAPSRQQLQLWQFTVKPGRSASTPTRLTAVLKNTSDHPLAAGTSSFKMLY